MKRLLVLAALVACTRVEPQRGPGAPPSSAPQVQTAPLVSATSDGSAAPRSGGVELGDLHVTRGAIVRHDGALKIDEPVVRAVLRAQTTQDVELAFHYLGPTATRTALGSGEERVQVGLKLRAMDGCNVVYAMLRIEPEVKVVVQVKRNPTEHTSDDCGNGGYRGVKSSLEPAAAVRPTIVVGSAHRLRATMRGSIVEVWLDGSLAFRGDAGPEAIAFDGPVGLRSDNGRFDQVSLTSPASP